MSVILSIENLHKKYGSTCVVNNVSFEVYAKETVGLIGQNGAGKTTIINMVLGVLTPTKGRILIKGLNVSTQRSRALNFTNFVSSSSLLPGNLTVRQNLRIFGLIYGVKLLSAKIETLLYDFDLKKFGDIKCGLLSSGEQIRVSLAKAMLTSPLLLVLDEPTSSIDPSMAAHVRSAIKDFTTQGMGGTLWTSHNMEEVEDVCDRVVFLSNGKILLQGDPKILATQYNMRSLKDLFITVSRNPQMFELT